MKDFVQGYITQLQNTLSQLPMEQIEKVIGSGPYVFKRDEWEPGHKVVYVKNEAYRPRSEPASGFAGGKVAHFDRVEWIYIPDPNTATFVGLMVLGPPSAGSVPLGEPVSAGNSPQPRDSTGKLLQECPTGRRHTI